VRRNESAEELAGDVADAIAASMVSPGQIASLIIPHDCQLGPTKFPVAPRPIAPPPLASKEAINRAAELLRTSRSPALFLGGLALSHRGLRAVARIATTSDCKLICETFPKRMERGAGTPSILRLPYFPEPAIAMLEQHDAIILAGARAPVSFFGYPGLPSYFISPEQTKHALVGPQEDVSAALEALADALDAPTNPRGTPDGGRPQRPTGPISLENLAAAIASAQPEGAIVMDEGNTSTFFYFGIAAGAPHFSHLTQPGGAIGCGMPCATGAAIACPDRPVINIQADGSAMYTLQSLWTQAREGLNVTTVICNNGGYRVLGLELQRAGMRELSPRVQSLIALADPTLDWVNLAAGMGVPGKRVDTSEALATELEVAVAQPGPFLIEALLS